MLLSGWRLVEFKTKPDVKHLTVLQLCLVPPLHQQSAVFVCIVLHRDLISFALAGLEVPREQVGRFVVAK